MFLSTNFPARNSCSLFALSVSCICFYSLVFELPLSALAQTTQKSSRLNAQQVSKGAVQSTVSGKKAILDPGQMYLRYHSTLIKPDSSFAELSPFLSKESLGKISSPGEAEQALGMIRSMAPREVGVKKVEINGSKAKVFLTTKEPMANPFAGQNSKSQTTGFAYFNLEDGMWKLDKESWKTKQAKATEASDPDWCMQASRLEFPRKAASGRIHGKSFQVDEARLKFHGLELKEGHEFFPVRSVEVHFQDKDYKNLEGKTFLIEEDAELTGPQLSMSWKDEGMKLPESKQYFADDGAGMQLRFLQKTATGRLPFWILLRLPDKDQSFVEGYGEAVLEKTE